MFLNTVTFNHLNCCHKVFHVRLYLSLLRLCVVNQVYMLKMTGS